MLQYWMYLVINVDALATAIFAVNYFITIAVPETNGQYDAGGIFGELSGLPDAHCGKLLKPSNDLKKSLSIVCSETGCRVLKGIWAPRSFPRTVRCM